jgi:hypothetical protein
MKWIIGCMLAIPNLMASEASTFNYVPTAIDVPFEMRLQSMDGPLIQVIVCDITFKESLDSAFKCIASRSPDIILSYNGCYNNRNIKGTDRKSNHAFGRAIDLNAGTSMPDVVVDCMKSAGLTWGGDWSPASYDPMHFELDVKGRYK